MDFIVDGKKWSVEEIMHEVVDPSSDVDVEELPNDVESSDEEAVPLGEEEEDTPCESEQSADEIHSIQYERNVILGEKPAGTSTSGGNEPNGSRIEQRTNPVTSECSRPPRKKNKSMTLQSKDKKMVWSTEQPEKRGRTSAKNLVTHMPGPKGLGKNAKTPLDAWNLLFSHTMVDTIVIYTNEEIGRRTENLTLRQSYHKKTDELEIGALIGIFYFMGVQKSSGASLEELWSPRYGLAIYRATMSMPRFRFLCWCLRFDDKTTRQERRKADPFAPVRYVWDCFISNCTSVYTPFEYCTVDEQLLSFRGRCSFRIYMTAKPDKYGIKLVLMNDSKTWYMISAIPYTGKVKTRNNEPVPTFYVRTLTESIHNSGRNVTCDNWFSSIPLFDLMLRDYNITTLGTLRKNKREIPPSFIQSAQPGTVKSAFSGQKILVSYAPKKNKVVLVLSTMHEFVEIEEETKKPNLVLDYNRTKGGTDTFDQLCHEYTTARGMRRWPMRVFYGMLDQGGINAMVLVKLNNPNSNMKRRHFLNDLSYDLMKPHLSRRFETETLRRGLKEILRGILGYPKPTGPDNAGQKLLKRARCSLCPRTADKKTNQKCSHCWKPTCDSHSTTEITCDECAE